MPVYRLDDNSLGFPPPSEADENGLLAIGGDFRPERMIAAYSMGIFPWSEYLGAPLWYSPDPRMVLTTDALHVGRSLKKILRRGDYEITLDAAFADVVQRCRDVPRPGQQGTWITSGYVTSMLRLHELGVAHSAEAWRDGELAGGLYGLCLGRVFFGESMFARAPNASKVAFVHLVRQLEAWEIDLIDCQMETPHLRRFGAVSWRRARFVDALAERVHAPTVGGPWRLTIGKVTG
ncbi:MAG: leucyl/phenylalanyl-tRNA--protein transferase [Proteobacteria bacterium]|nr:MAG: leucyl/phenylalanyl-tRNA--protein transferase [Pseudomonadota bacterium]